MIKKYDKEVNGIRAFYNGIDLEYSIESGMNCSGGFVIPFCSTDEEVLSSFFDIKPNKNFKGIIFTNKRFVNVRIDIRDEGIIFTSVPYSQIVYWEKFYNITSYGTEVRFTIYGNKLYDGETQPLSHFSFDIKDDYHNEFERLLAERVGE